MILYILVEGDTEARILPSWLKKIAPQLSENNRAQTKKDNSYYLFNARGFPSIIFQHLPNAIEEVNNLGFYDYLVVLFDVDTESVEERMQAALENLLKEGKELKQGELVFCLPNCCIETWFLGNRKLFKRNPQNPRLREMVSFYNVNRQDPENMDSPSQFDGERQQFHKAYFKLLARERMMAYRESNPGQTRSSEFLQQLIDRHQETGQLSTFGKFYNFFDQLPQ